MNWSKLEDLVRTARVSKRPPQFSAFGARRRVRKLAHETYAFEDVSFDFDIEPGGGQKRVIHITLFGKTIITYRPDSTVSVNNHEYWRSSCIRNRLNRFLPWNSSIVTWTINRAWPDNKPRQKAYVWGLWTPGIGTRPWRNGCTFDINGCRTDLSEELNGIDARELIPQVLEFSKLLVKDLVQGKLGSDDWCPDCLAGSQGPVRAEHLLMHVLNKKPSFSLIRRATQDHHAVTVMQKENRVLWKEPRSQKQLAERVQRMMIVPDLARPNFYPPMYQPYIRWRVYKFLLEGLGFQVGE